MIACRALDFEKLDVLKAFKTPLNRFTEPLNIYIYIYLCVCVFIYLFIVIHLFKAYTYIRECEFL